MPLPRFDMTELGNAHRFLSLHKDIVRWVPQTARWYVFNGAFWKEDVGSVAVTKLMSQLGEEILTELDEALEADPLSVEEKVAKRIQSWAGQSGKSSTVTGALSFVKALCNCPQTDFDKNPKLLNVVNGTITLRPTVKNPVNFNPEDMLTHQLPVTFDKSAKCPRWESFLEEVLPEQSVREFFQKLCGYMLLGNNPKHIFLVLYGDGRNGKSTVLRVLANMFGPTATLMAKQCVVASRSGFEAHTTIMADLEGSRMAYLDETDTDVYLDDAKVKTITGQATNVARKMRRDNMSFSVTWVPIISTNHKPHIKDKSKAIWERIVPIQFPVHIERAKRDDELFEKLELELNGIFLWALKGMVAYNKSGLSYPRTIKKAIERYKIEEDKTALFLDEECVLDRTGELQIRRSELYAAFQQWCNEAGVYAESKSKFYVDMRAKGFAESRKDGYDYFRGVDIATDTQKRQRISWGRRTGNSDDD